MKPIQRRIQEFWNVERIEYVRRCALTGYPPYIKNEPSRYGRLLDRMIFRDLKTEELMRLVEKADRLDVDVSIDFFGIRLSAPIYLADMSFGALSGNPNIAMARAATEEGVLAGVGEGGLHPEVGRYRNIVIQWASARFGVDLDLLRAGVAVNIKIGQGAKPGIGGHLPGSKVTKAIAEVRKIPEGIDALSPAPHHDIYSIEDLAQRVKALRDLTGKPILVKVAAVNKIMYVAVGVARSSAEGIIIDGAGGGTGATPLAIRDHLGIPIDYAIPVVDKWLKDNDVRSGFLVIAGGMLYSAEDIAKLIALGADMAYIGTAALVAMGCIMCHQCNTGKCPAALTNMIGYGREIDVDWAVERLRQYIRAIKRGLKAILYALGMSSIRELVGRKDLLELYNVDEEVAKTIGVELAEEGDTAYFEEYEIDVPREVYEEGKAPIVGGGGVVPGYTTPARRLLDVLRIEAAQVTHPAVDPYREDIDISIRISGHRLSNPILVPGFDRACIMAGYAMGSLVDSAECPEPAFCLEYYRPIRLPPSLKIEPRPGVVVIDERLKGDVTLEEAISALDLKARELGVRDKMVIVAIGRLHNGADVYKMAALGADIVCPLGLFERVFEKARGRDYKTRRLWIENSIRAIVKELKLAMGAGGITSYEHMVGNRDLLRSLDGKIAKRLNVEVAGR